MRVSSLARRRTVLFGSLLLAALVVFAGCPDDGGNVTPPSAPPTGLSVEVMGGQAVLSWEAVTAATEYYIYRDGTRIATDVEVTATTYTDSDFPRRGVYNYAVSAVNAGGESSASGSVRAVILLPTVVVAGNSHTCALLGNGEVKCWGRGLNGRLGQGNTTTLNAPPANAVALGTDRTATQVSAGLSHTCALLDRNEIKCWGAGNNGRLGQGNNDTIGDEPGELGDNLMPIAF